MNNISIFNLSTSKIILFFGLYYLAFLNVAFSQIKIFPDGNTTVGTLTQFEVNTKLQILAGAGSSDPVGLWINCLNHTNKLCLLSDE